MSDIAKPSDLQGRVWASTGSITYPVDAEVGLGWVEGEIPTASEFNYLQNRTDRYLEYLLQKGVPEWDTLSKYIANESFTTRFGCLYLANLNNVGVDPSSDTLEVNWTKLIDSSGSIPRNRESFLLDRVNHIGTQAQSTVVNLVSDLAAKEVVINKSTDFTVVDNIRYPTVQAVVNYVTGAGGTTYLKTEVTTNFITTNTNLSVFRTYDVDTTSGTFNLTLPSTPAIGDWIGLNDIKGTWLVNPPELLRNGNNIEYLGQNQTLDVRFWSGYFEYRGATAGWVSRR